MQENKVTTMRHIFEAKFNPNGLPVYMVAKQIYKPEVMISSLGGGNLAVFKWYVTYCRLSLDEDVESYFLFENT